MQQGFCQVSVSSWIRTSGPPPAGGSDSGSCLSFQQWLWWNQTFFLPVMRAAAMLEREVRRFNWGVGVTPSFPVEKSQLVFPKSEFPTSDHNWNASHPQLDSVEGDFSFNLDQGHDLWPVELWGCLVIYLSFTLWPPTSGWSCWDIRCFLLWKMMMEMTFDPSQVNHQHQPDIFRLQLKLPFPSIMDNILY